MAEDERENAMHVIAVDAMGGDNAPQAIVEGVNQAIDSPNPKPNQRDGRADKACGRLFVRRQALSNH